MNQTIGELPVYGEYDAIVSGGGLIGTVCAVKLARSGQRVALVERRSTLGWELTRARRIFARPTSDLPVSSRLLNDLTNAAWPDSQRETFFNAPAVELELDRWVLEADVDVMFHGWSRNIVESSGRVSGLIVGTREGYMRLNAPLVIETDDYGRLVDEDIPRVAISAPVQRSCLLYDASLPGERVLEQGNGDYVSMRPLSADRCRLDLVLQGSDLQSRDREFHAAVADVLPLVRNEQGCREAKLFYLAEEEWSLSGFRLLDGFAQEELPVGKLLQATPNRSRRTHELTTRHIGVSRMTGLIFGGPWLPCYLDNSADEEDIALINRVLLGEAVAALAGGLTDVGTMTLHGSDF